VPSAAQPKPAVPAAVIAAPASRPARSPKFNDVMTAVMYRDAAAAKELLELGWWADRPDSNGVTPLMAAAWNGDVAMTQLLLNGGADPNRRGPGGSVLDYAGRGGDIQVVELLKRSGAR
jgi:ankyrin repeat protein